MLCEEFAADGGEVCMGFEEYTMLGLTTRGIASDHLTGTTRQRLGNVVRIRQGCGGEHELRVRPVVMCQAMEAPE
jgi:hypothetical protein